jgi:K+-sensing histidine kinase KdpD
VEESRETNRRRAFTIGAIVATVLLAFSVIYANAYSTRVVTANTRALHWTNANLGSAAVLRAASNQAILFARDAKNGSTTQAASLLAASEAEKTIRSFAEASFDSRAALGRDTSEIDALADSLLSTAKDMRANASSGEWEAARTLLNDRFEPAYVEFTDLLAAEQEEIIARIDATDDFAGLVAGAIRFVVILLLPIVAFVTYRRIVAGQMREQKRILSAQLEYERKLHDSKDDLIAGISHQLRTPLTTIYGMSHVLTGDSVTDPGTTQELLEIIHSESYELDRMVSDLLAMARLEAGAAEFKSESVDVAEVIRLAVEPARRAGHEIVVVRGDMEVALADKARVVHIIRTLLSNANKHGGPSTRVIAGETEGKVKILVEDDGPGVKDPERLFTGFVNEGREALLSGSVGIGLAVAQMTALNMNGKIEYLRKEDRTYFVLTLPNARVDVRVPNEAEHEKVGAS